jgi:hypothetical protein
MLAMTTLRQIYNTVEGLADHGRRLPAVERSDWQTLAAQFQELADCEAGYRHAEDAPADYGGQVWTLHDRLQRTDRSAASLAARWLTGWLTEFADPETFGAVRGAPLAVAIARQLPGSRQGEARAARARPRPPARHPTRPHANDGWAVLVVSDVTLQTAVDHGFLVTISSAAELMCLADRRPWEWQRDGSAYQAHIGPAPGPGDPAAYELAADLERLANGLNPGPWRVSVISSQGRRPEP